MLDQHQAAAEEMAARMAVRYRDLPESWGMDDRTWYVYLNTDAFTDNRFDKAGVRNKHYKSPGAGVAEREIAPFSLLVFFLIVVSIKPSILLRI